MIRDAALPEGLAFVAPDEVLCAAAGARAVVRAVVRKSLTPSRGPQRDRSGLEAHVIDTMARPVDIAVRGSLSVVLDRFGPKVVTFRVADASLAVVSEALLPFSRDPEAIEALPEGGFLVLDAGRNEILVLDDAFGLMRTIGHPGSDFSGINCPHDLALGVDGVLYVADSGNRRIQRFRLDGTPLGPWGRRGEGPGEFNNPTGVALDQDGNLIVVDHYRHSFQVLDTRTGAEFVDRRLVLPEEVRYPARLAVLPGNRCIFTCPQMSQIWEMTCP